MIKTKTPRNETVYWVGAAGSAQDAGPGTDFTLSRPTACPHTAADGPYASAADSRDQNVAGGENSAPENPRNRDDLTAHARTAWSRACGEGNTRRGRARRDGRHSAPYFHRGSAREPRLRGLPPCRSASSRPSRNPFVVARMIEALRGEAPLETCSKSVPAADTRRHCSRGCNRSLFGRAHCGIAGKGARQPRPLRLVKPEVVHADGPGIARGSAFRRHHRRGGGSQSSRCAFAARWRGWQNDCARGSGDQALCLIERAPSGFTENGSTPCVSLPLRGGKQ